MTWVGAFIIFLFVFSYDFVAPFIGISELAWRAPMCTMFCLYWEYSAAKILKEFPGTQNATGIVELGNPHYVAKLERIRKISGRFWTEGRIFAPAIFYVRITMADVENKISLGRQELLKLLDTKLNRWFIDYDTFSIEPSEEETHVEYSPIGKYALEASTTLIIKALAYVALPVFILLGEFTAFSTSHAVGIVALILVIFFVSRRYCRVVVVLSSEGVMLKDENGGGHFLAYADVSKVEKKIFKIEVTAKDGRVLFFPRACYLLPELIEAVAGLKKE